MHLPTLIIITLVVNIIIGVYLFLLYRRRPKDSCFKLWAGSCACFVMGGMAASFRSSGQLSVISYFLADVLLVSAPFLVVVGLLQFSRFRFTKTRRKNAYGIYILTIALLLFTYQQPALISLITSIQIALTFLLAAFLLRQSVFNEPIYTRTLQAIFILHSVTMISQATLICLHWQTFDPRGLPSGTLVTLLTHIVLTTLTALLLPWLSFMKLERKLTLKSQRDGLTKLANRDFFFNYTERHWRNHPYNATVLMMIDIDHFKAINDTFGHGTGDLAIKSVASVLAKGLRSDDFIGRIGGEEFAAILTKLDFETAIKIAHRLCTQVERQHQYLESHKVDITISIGLVQVIPAEQTISEAFNAADKAMYQSKQAGRNQVTVGHFPRHNNPITIP